MLQIFDQSTVQPSSAAKRSLAARASDSMEASTSASRSRISSVVSQRPTTAVTIPGKVFTLPIVATASGCFRAIGRISSASFAAAANASRLTPHRSRAGVRLLPMKRDRVALDPFRSQHNAKRQTQTFKNWPLLNMQLEVSGRIVPLDTCIPNPVDLDATLPKSSL